MNSEEWEQKVKETWHRISMDAMAEVDALLAADWKIAFLEMSPGLENWQWKWRSPPKRKGSKGRLYLSTTQAYNALKRCSPPNKS